MDALAERNLAAAAPANAPTDAASEASLRARLARNPADTSALLLLALELERQRRRDEADRAMRTAVRLAPADPQFLILAAGYFLRTGAEAEALAISDGRIAAVGSDAEVMKLAGPTTAVIDCQRRRVIPGLHDGHAHPIRGGLISRDKDRGRAANGECAVRSARPERAGVAGGPSRK